MKNSLKTLGAIALLAIVSLSTGCTRTRSITASYWHSSDVYYLAYIENTGTAVKAKIKSCRVQEGNAIACKKLKPVNKLLNKD